MVGQANARKVAGVIFKMMQEGRIVGRAMLLLDIHRRERPFVGCVYVIFFAYFALNMRDRYGADAGSRCSLHRDCRQRQQHTLVVDVKDGGLVYATRKRQNSSKEKPSRYMHEISVTKLSSLTATAFQATNTRKLTIDIEAIYDKNDWTFSRRRRS